MFSTHSCSRWATFIWEHFCRELRECLNHLVPPADKAGVALVEQVRCPGRRYQLPGKICAALRKILCKQDETPSTLQWKSSKADNICTFMYYKELAWKSFRLKNIIFSYIPSQSRQSPSEEQSLEAKRESAGSRQVIAFLVISHRKIEEFLISICCVWVLVSNSPDTLS